MLKACTLGDKTTFWIQLFSFQKFMFFFLNFIRIIIFLLKFAQVFLKLFFLVWFVTFTRQFPWVEEINVVTRAIGEGNKGLLHLQRRKNVTTRQQQQQEQEQEQKQAAEFVQRMLFKLWQRGSSVGAQIIFCSAPQQIACLAPTSSPPTSSFGTNYAPA